MSFLEINFLIELDLRSFKFLSTVKFKHLTYLLMKKKESLKTKLLSRLTHKMIIILCVLFIAVSSNAFAQAFKVLVFTKTTGYRHEGAITNGKVMITALGSTNGYTTVNTENPADFTDANLANYKVVVWANTSGNNILSTAQKVSFEKFILNGGGFVGIHAASDTYRDKSWPWFNDLVGAIVQNCPNHTTQGLQGTMDVLDQSNETVNHLGATWTKGEEWYYWRNTGCGGYLFNGNINLLRVRATGGNPDDEARPTTWYKEYKGGRSFYTALGHDGSDYIANSNFGKMIAKAIVWASKKNVVVDNCPNDPTKTQPGNCGCGVPETPSCGVTPVGPAGYTYSAKEFGTVTVTGTMDIAYGSGGASGTYNYLKTQTTNVGCNNTAFVYDPTPGIPKFCFTKPSVVDNCPNDPAKTQPGNCGCGVPETPSCGVTPVGPIGYTYSAKEFGTVTVTGKMDIAYGSGGASGTYNYLKNQTSNVGCNNTVFVYDPTPGIPKFCFTKPSTTTGLVNGAVYKIDGKQSGKGLDVFGVSLDNGGRVHLYNYGGGNNQKWRAEYLGAGTWKFVSINSEKCLEVGGYSNADKAKIQQWSYVGHNYQQWLVTSNTDGSFKVINKGSGYSIHAAGTANFDSIYQRPYLGTDNQKWIFTRVDGMIRHADEEFIDPSGFSFANTVTLSPNPTTGISSIDVASNSIVKVVDHSGKVVFQKETLISGSILIDLSGQQAGIYQVQITTNGIIKTQKLILQK